MQPVATTEATSTRPADLVGITLMRWLGPDIFISYRHSARGYARALRDELEKLGPRCFLDEDWQPPGDNIELYKTIARRSRMFVLIGSRTVLESKHIPKELDAYSRAHGGWVSRRWHRIFPISVSGALKNFEGSDTSEPYRNILWAPLIGLVAEAETDEALFSGQPSGSIPKRIARTYGLLSGTRLLLLGTALLAVLIVAATILTVRWRVGTAQDQIRGAKAELAQVTEQKKKAEKDRDDFGMQAKLASAAADAAHGLADQETERARQQQTIADAYSLLDRARRMSITDWQGGLNVDRALLVAKSWKKYPSAAALQLISETVGMLPRKVVGFDSHTGPLSLAVDPTGVLLSGSDKKELVVWTRGGVRLWREKLDGDTRGFRFTKDGKDLVIVTGTRFRRVQTSDWHEVANIPFGREAWPKLSADGEWIALQGQQNVVLFPTRNPDAKQTFPGQQVCFPDSDTLYTLISNADGNDQIFEHRLGDEFRSLFPDQTHNTQLRGATLAGCYPGTIIITSAADGLVAYPIDATLLGGRNAKPLPSYANEVYYNQVNNVLLSLHDSPMSQLFSLERDGEWALHTFLPEGSAGAFGADQQVVMGNAEDGSVTIWDYSDQRLPVNGVSEDKVPHTLLSAFERNWHPLYDPILGELHASFLSPNKRWKCTVTEKGEWITNAKEGNQILAPSVFFPANTRPEAAFSTDEKMFAVREDALDASFYRKEKPRYWIWSLDAKRYYEQMCRGIGLLTFDRDASDCATLPTNRVVVLPFE
jgi:hypothetical protein